MRVMWLILFCGGCAGDPAVDAWHDAFKITSYERADDDCDATPIAEAPAAPYLFVAVSRGIPDVVSLYLCPEPRDCGAPFENGALYTLNERKIAADVASAQVFAGLCSITWSQIEGTLQADQATVTVSSGFEERVGVSDDVCLDEASDAIGADCQARVTIAGTRVE